MPRYPARYPARFSLCRLVTTAGRLCPQPVNLHQQKERVVPDHLDHQRQRQKREKQPLPATTTTTSATQRRKEGKGQIDVLVTDLPPHTNWRVEGVCLSDGRWDFSSFSLLHLRVSPLRHPPLARGCGPSSNLLPP